MTDKRHYRSKYKQLNIKRTSIVRYSV